MTPADFIKEFGHLADAPDGIKKLRELILQLAVRGKLVPQRASDEPASELLKNIAAERAKLVNEGRIKKQQPLPAIGADEAPYELPTGWEWVRLREISCDCGQTVPKKRFTYIDVGSIDKERGIISEEMQVLEPANAPSRARKLVTMNSVIYSTVRPYLLNIAVVDKTIDPSPIVSTAFFVIDLFGQISSRFLYHYLRSHPFIDYVNASMTGMAYPAINDAKMALGPIPLPPLAEQHRIVAKVDQLMKLCDELEVKQQEREKARLTVNKSCLNALTASDSDAGSLNWKRLRDNFALLYDNPETVSELRKSILQLAVMGRLVRQNPADEPASELLKKIQAEKTRLVNLPAGRQEKGKIKKQQPLPALSKDEMPYELPNGWEWVRLENLASNIHYGFNASAVHSQTDVRLLRITDIQNDQVKWDSVPGCDISASQLASYKLSDGDIVIARTGGTIGKSYLVTNLQTTAVFASYLIRVAPVNRQLSSFIKVFLGSACYWSQLYEKSMGTGQPNVNGTSLKSLLFPLPPLAEQHRIVAKVDQLMMLCDELETKLQQSRADANSLIAAVVNHLTEAV